MHTHAQAEGGGRLRKGPAPVAENPYTKQPIDPLTNQPLGPRRNGSEPDIAPTPMEPTPKSLGKLESRWLKDHNTDLDVLFQASDFQAPVGQPGGGGEVMTEFVVTGSV